MWVSGRVDLPYSAQCGGSRSPCQLRQCWDRQSSRVRPPWVGPGGTAEEVVGPGILCICNSRIPGGKSWRKSPGEWGLAGERCLDPDTGMDGAGGRVCVRVTTCRGVPQVRPDGGRGGLGRVVETEGSPKCQAKGPGPYHGSP